jgi:hypothetical protein
MWQIDLIWDDDVMAFICVTNEMLDIDSHYPPAVSVICHQPPHPVTQPHTTPSAITSTAAPPPPTTASIQSTLNCSNCHACGHTVNTCFKAGGGLEGQCDKYQANHTRVQAHLAHLDDAIAN